MDGGTALADRKHQDNDPDDPTRTKGTPTALKPFRFEQVLSSLHEGVIRRLIGNYKTAYSMSYSRGASGSVSRQPIWQSDPTGDVAAQKEWARNAVAFAAVKITEALKAIDAADAALAQLTEKRGPYKRLDNRITAEEEQAAKKEMRRQVGRKPSAGKP